MERREFLKLSAAAASVITPNFDIWKPQPIDNEKILYTFDDNPFDPERMKKLVEILKENRCKSQFYLTGEGMRRYPESVEYLLSNGYDIGWHSMEHDVMSRKSDSDFAADVVTWKKTLKEIAPSFAPQWARFPYGRGKYREIKILHEEGLYLQRCATKGACGSNWDVDTLDWNPYRVLSARRICSMVSHIQSRHSNPAVILFHLSLGKPLIYSSLSHHRTRSGDYVVPESVYTGQSDVFQNVVSHLCGNYISPLPSLY